jgi:DNA-binding NarL/FixJ family response regulator
VPSNANKPSRLPPQLLLVDKDTNSTFDLEVTLTAAGFEICGVARNSARALRLAQSRSPDAIVMNVDLGRGSDGITTAIMMRSIGIRAPIIFLAGYDAASTRDHAESVQNSWLVTEPVIPEALEETIREALMA